jgi:hypothetical protein
MAKNSNKTQENTRSVLEYLENVTPAKKRNDSFALLKIMEEVTGEEAKMWGPSIIGFGNYKYRYESGREGEWFLCGFAPRKAALTLYIMGGFDGHDQLMANLGKHKIGKACLYVKKLEDVDQDVLRELIQKSAAHVAATSVD